MVLFQCRGSDTNGSVLVRECLLRCEEEVCFKILKWFNLKNKIRLLDFLSPPKMILIHNFHKRNALKCARKGKKVNVAF